jgi:hypothetical protein
VFENFVDQRNVEVIVGKFDSLDVSDRDAPLGQSPQTDGFADLLCAVLDSPRVCTEVRKRPDILTRTAPAVDHVLAAQRSRNGTDPVEAFL